MASTPKRSPSYPRISLDKAIDLARKIYVSAYDSAVDTETIFGLMGYQGRSGPSASSLSALKQYGLIEGRDQDLRVTSLALRIIHPAHEQEKAEALAEAVFGPPLYSEIKSQFGGRVPADQVLKSYLVRTHDFNPNGADDFIRTLRDNRPHMDRASAPTLGQVATDPSEKDELTQSRTPGRGEAEHDTSSRSDADFDESDDGRREVLRFRVSPTCLVRITFMGPLSRAAVAKTIQYLELAKDQYAD